MIKFDLENDSVSFSPDDITEVLQVLNYVKSLQMGRGAEVLTEAEPKVITSTSTARNVVPAARKRKRKFSFKKWVRRKLYRVRKHLRKIKRTFRHSRGAGGSGSASRGGSPRRGAGSRGTV